MRHALLGFLLLVFLRTAATGQPLVSDTLFLQAAKKQAIGLYQKTMYGQEQVYSGNEYIAQDHRIKIHPYYPADSLQAGSITYDGVLHQDVAMLYDIVRDELTVRPPASGYRVQVRSSKITHFSMGTHQFIRLDTTSGLAAGFYELLYRGSVQVLAHRKKVVQEDISSGVYEAAYLSKDRFYIRKDGAYHDVKSKGSVLSLFPEQSKMLRKYLRSNGIKFNNAQREEAITGVVQQYDVLHQATQ